MTACALITRGCVTSRHRRATDLFLSSRSAVSRPQPNWRDLGELPKLAPLKAKAEAARRKGRESFY